MKQFVFISGKGGTGKSTVVASLAKYVNNKALADVDVDAPNLHILLDHEVVEKIPFKGAKIAKIDQSKCTNCHKGYEVCRFDAISKDDIINPLKCEGCGACLLVCPENAITLHDELTGHVYQSKINEEHFTHALLAVGAEGSGKLVAEVKKKVKELVKEEDYLLIDGSPGIGCVVIASITGADACVIVTEATKSGLSDLQRVQQVADHFGIKSFVCINKYDLNIDVTKKIEEYCKNKNVSVIGKIPFEPLIVKALQQFKTPMDDDKLGHIKSEIISLWNQLIKET
ncbi:MAG: ATP-binding protein [Clostridiales bacterium]|nr:ATP-binding protein [Clostridiales bacterium]